MKYILTVSNLVCFRRVNKETDHGPSTGLITVDDLECLGTEDDISECKASEWGTHNCGHDEDIAVTCGKLFSLLNCSFVCAGCNLN